MKRCPRCKTVKTKAEFHKKASAKDGLQTICKECNKAKVVNWQKENPEYWLTQKNRAEDIAIQRRARLYGITVEEVRRLMEKTHCQICGTEFGDNKKHMDHDHKTGRVRGVLCGTCNRGLGHFNDSTELLRKAIQYLNTGM